MTAAQVVLDTGTRSLIPPIPGLDQLDFLDAENWLDRAELPGRLAMIGGGSIGLEMAQFYRRLGSDVVVIEGTDQIGGQRMRTSPRLCSNCSQPKPSSSA